MAKHIHHDAIVAWAEGSPIQYQPIGSSSWYDTNKPAWVDSHNYRVKPEPEPDMVRWASLNEASPWPDTQSQTTVWTVSRCPGDNLKATFDGETGELKSVEIVQ